MQETSEATTEFDAYARNYEELLHDPLRERFAGEGRFFMERKLEVIESFLRARKLQPKTMNWLDVGCGLGDLLKIGRTSFASVKGCDPAKEMLQACGDLDVRHQASNLQIPFDSQAFDFVTAVCVYHHIPPEERSVFTAEIVRVVRPGGIFAIVEHNPWSPVTRLIVSRASIDHNAVLLNAGECKRLARAAGATPISTRYFLFLPKTLHRHAGWIEDAARPIPLGGQYAVFSSL